MRTENVLEIRSTDAIGPLRIRLLGAASAQQAVVVMSGDGADPTFHVFAVAEVIAALAARTGEAGLSDALELGRRAPVAAVSLRTATDADVGRPVVENGRLLGVVAGEILRAESTEDEMGRTMTPPAGEQPEAGASEPKPKRRWGFLSR